METLDLSTPASPYSLSNRDRKPVTYTPPQFEEAVGYAEAPRVNIQDSVSIIKSIWNDKDSQQVFVYLCLRIVFTFAALFTSSFSNSVGLVCIAFHALFECVGLGVDLWTDAAAKYIETSHLGFSYGYQRLRVLSAFGNAVFLIFVSLFTLEHAVEGIFEPPQVHSGSVMTIAVVGCILNFIGLLISVTSNDAKKNKLRGEVLWFLLVADNLASFSVIFSAYFVQMGYNEADPLVAGLISIIVIYTSIPLAKETGQILLLATPKHISRDLYKCLGEVLSVEGVHECTKEHFWTQSNGYIVGSLHVTISKEANEQDTLRKVNNIFRPYVQNLTIQINRMDWAVRSPVH